MDGKVIELMVNSFLTRYNRGEEDIPPPLIKEFSAGIEKNFLTNMARSKHDKFTLRMSSLGKPLCQIQMEKAGAPRHPVDEPLAPVRFATGDMLEHWLIMILKAAGVPVEAVDINTKLELAGQTINGTADIIIDGILYDIKSASSYGFNKFSERGGFLDVLENDTFGYVTQGYLYSKAIGKPFGGWIVINKNDGAIAVCETPQEDTKYARDAVKKGEDAVIAIMESSEFKRCFEDEEETFRKKPTGNRVLPFVCSWCDYKHSCWKDLTHRPQVMSKARDVKWAWYTDLQYIPAEDANENEQL